MSAKGADKDWRIGDFTESYYNYKGFRITATKTKDTRHTTQLSNYLPPYASGSKIHRFCYEKRVRMKYWSSKVLCDYRGGMNFVDVHDAKATSFSMIRKSMSLMDTPWFWFLDHTLVNAQNIMLQQELGWSSTRKTQEMFRLRVYEQWLTDYIQDRDGTLDLAKFVVKEETAEAVAAAKAKSADDTQEIIPANQVQPTSKMAGAGCRCEYKGPNDANKCGKAPGIRCLRCGDDFCFIWRKDDGGRDCYSKHVCKPKPKS